LVILIVRSVSVIPSTGSTSALQLADVLGGGERGDWSPGLALPPSLWELFGSGSDVAAEAMALAVSTGLAGRRAASEPWLWVQDRQSIRRSGYPYLHGLPPALRGSLIHVTASRPVDTLWAMEEGVKCGALSFVIGEITDDPKALDFTATRRLVLASEASGVPLLLIRKNGAANLSAARLRWRVEAAPSLVHRWNERAPGQATCRAELFRARGLRPATFHLMYGIGGDEHKTAETAADHHLDLVPQTGDRSLDEGRRAAG
jgi:protein ImuA